jgi:hypothetical protein
MLGEPAFEARVALIELEVVSARAGAMVSAVDYVVVELKAVSAEWIRIENLHSIEPVVSMLAVRGQAVAKTWSIPPLREALLLLAMGADLLMTRLYRRQLLAPKSWKAGLGWLSSKLMFSLWLAQISRANSFQARMKMIGLIQKSWAPISAQERGSYRIAQS